MAEKKNNIDIFDLDILDNKVSELKTKIDSFMLDYDMSCEAVSIKLKSLEALQNEVNTLKNQPQKAEVKDYSSDIEALTNTIEGKKKEIEDTLSCHKKEVLDYVDRAVGSGISLGRVRKMIQEEVTASSWGNITGTLSNQTDLQTVLDAKQDDITLTTDGTSGAATLIGATLNIPQYSTDLSGYVPYTGATGNVDLGTHTLTASQITASPTGNNVAITANGSGSGAGIEITHSGSGTKLLIGDSGSGDLINAGSGKLLLTDGGALSLSGLTASTILSSDSSKNITSLSTATYPSLTELSYVKGLTSSAQTQISARLTALSTLTANKLIKGGGSLAVSPSNITDDGTNITAQCTGNAALIGGNSAYAGIQGGSVGVYITEAAAGGPIVTRNIGYAGTLPAEYRYFEKVQTTNATVTTLYSFPTTTDRAYSLKIRVIGRRTGGSSGTAGDIAVYHIEQAARNVGGTVTLLGTANITYQFEHQSGWDCTLDVSGTAVRVRVTGAANNNIDWGVDFSAVVVI